MAILSLVLILLVSVSSTEEEPRLIHFADLKTSQSGLLGSEAPQDSNGMVLLRFRELQKQQPGLAKEEKKRKITIFNFYNSAKANDYDWLSSELADSLSRNLPKISGVDLAELPCRLEQLRYGTFEDRRPLSGLYCGSRVSSQKSPQHNEDQLLRPQ